MTLSHEFRSPLGSCLMLLESLLSRVKDKVMRDILLTIVSQINLLLCLVNDILDIKMMAEDKFVSRMEYFNPDETFKFIIKIFQK